MPDDAMDSTVVDLMETETETTSTLPPHQASNSEQGCEDIVRSFITLARQLIEQARPSQALQAVVMAMKTKGGDEAVREVLNRAQELYRNKIKETAAAEELASLFAECAIAEALPMRSGQSEHSMAGSSRELDAHGTSILAETGRRQIVLDAFSDGSSFVCLQCGGLVSNSRKDEHNTYWCGQI